MTIITNLLRVLGPPLPKTKRKALLKEILPGRLLTGLFVEDDQLYLRFTDAVMTVNLPTRDYSFGGRKPADCWLGLFGWLRIQRVYEEQTQITLEVGGTLYTARIHVRHSQDRWHIVFSGGRGLASE
jgi:hypothetical protein